MLADGFPLVGLERTAFCKLSGPNGLIANITDRSRSPAVYSIVFSIHFCPGYLHDVTFPSSQQLYTRQAGASLHFLFLYKEQEQNFYTFHATKYKGEAVEAERWWSAIVNPICNWKQHASFPPP